MLNYRKYNLWRAFIDFLFDNGEAVASLTHIKDRGQKPYPMYDQNGQNQLKLIPYLWPKRLKNHTLWGRTYLYSPYKGVPPPPRGAASKPNVQKRSWGNMFHLNFIRKSIAQNFANVLPLYDGMFKFIVLHAIAKDSVYRQFYQLFYGPWPYLSFRKLNSALK